METNLSQKNLSCTSPNSVCDGLKILRRFVSAEFVDFVTLVCVSINIWLTIIIFITESRLTNIRNRVREKPFDEKGWSPRTYSLVSPMQ